MRRLFLIIAVIMILVPTMAQKNHRNAEPDFAAYFMNAYQFWNNDEIYVNINWRQDGYAIAYSGGVYGYVDEDYINW